jgi:hypothetical protein
VRRLIPALLAACALAAFPARAQDDQALLQTLNRIAAAVDHQGPVEFSETDADGATHKQRAQVSFKPRGMDCSFAFVIALFTDGQKQDDLEENLRLDKVTAIGLQNVAELSGTPTTPQIYAVAIHQGAQKPALLMFRDRATAHEMVLALHRAVAFCGGVTTIDEGDTGAPGAST